MEYDYDTREHLGWALYPRLAAFFQYGHWFNFERWDLTNVTNIALKECFLFLLPSGYLTVCHGKSPCYY